MFLLILLHCSLISVLRRTTHDWTHDTILKHTTDSDKTDVELLYVHVQLLTLMSTTLVNKEM